MVMSTKWLFMRSWLQCLMVTNTAVNMRCTQHVTNIWHEGALFKSSTFHQRKVDTNVEETRKKTVKTQTIIKANSTFFQPTARYQWQRSRLGIRSHNINTKETSRNVMTKVIAEHDKQIEVKRRSSEDSPNDISSFIHARHHLQTTNSKRAEMTRIRTVVSF